MRRRKPDAQMSRDQQPDYSEIGAVLENCEQLVQDLSRAHERYNLLSEDEIAHFDQEALRLGDYIREACNGVLRQALELEVGDVEDPSDVLRLRNKSVGCELAFQLKELAAAVGGWGVWSCNVPFQAASAAYVGYRDQQQTEDQQRRKEAARRDKIRMKKLGTRKPSRLYAAAYAEADKIIARHPAITDAALLVRIERNLPEGTHLPSERQLRRYRTGH